MPQPPERGLSRRRLLELGGGFAAGAIVGGGTGAAAATSRSGKADATEAVTFDGPHGQAGVTLERRRHLAFAAFDLDVDLTGRFGRGELAALLQDWSTAARVLATGAALPQALGAAGALGAPADTGEAAGLGPARLTITLGLGPGVFDATRALVPAAARPKRFEPLPAFRGDALEEAWSGGDLAISAEADDPQVAVHAIHNLTRIARGAARLRWLQRGFVPATGAKEQAPRNLMGFQDGQSMLDHRDAKAAAAQLWAGSDAPTWMRGGGTYLLVRRIRMDLEPWDTATVEHQETTIGRTRAEGFFLADTGVGGAGYEGEPADRGSAESRGSHAAVARDAVFATGQILRRPYSYADGVVPATGQLDAGLIFLAYQRSIPDQFIPMQERLARFDALGEYVTPIGSAVFAIPPASRDARDWIGQGLLA